ncbi:Protein of unknown function DUF227 [Trinorchestia longiramus]|nr:Protein of unknown function DUF227 [Trinorchestia longiramus]
MSKQVMSQAQQKSPSSATYNFIRQNDIVKALAEAEGSDARLEKYEVRDFTKKGDNYMGTLTSVAVCYTQCAVPKQTSFIVKATPVHASAVYEFAMYAFTKESDFYSKLVPLLDHELTVIGQPPLQVPECYLAIDRNGGKVLYLEDLRLRDFKLCDRKSSLDLEHMTLICRELARLHAASSIFMAKNHSVGLKLIELFPCVEDVFSILKKESKSLASYEEFFRSFLLTGIAAAEINPGYEKMAQFLRKEISSAHELYNMQRQTSTQFFSVCHGDAWNNNFLFRYDGSGRVVECKFLDLQFHRVASVVVDLHYLSYTSVDRDFRKKHWDSVLSSYHLSHAVVMRAAGFDPKFTVDDLKQEYREKMKFGLMVSLVMSPLVYENSDEVIDVDILLKKMTEDDKQKLHQLITNKLKTNSLLNSRLLEMFDDMMEANVVNCQETGSVVRRLDQLSGDWISCQETGSVVRRLDQLSGDWISCQETGSVVRRLVQLSGDWISCQETGSDCTMYDHLAN